MGAGLSLYFDTEMLSLSLTSTSTSATLTGKTSGNVHFVGTDSVQIVPAK